MKATKLISELADLINKYGDQDVEIELLTSKGDYRSSIDCVDWIINDANQYSFVISHDIENVKEFKENLK